MGRVTLFGFLQYDPTLFDDIKLPETFDKKVLIDTIIMESGDLYPYYQHPLYLKANINNWFSRMYNNFERTMNALTVDYNPIENFDRYEDYSDAKVSKLNGSSSSYGTSNTENKTSAYNSGSYQPDSTTSNSNNTGVSQNTNSAEDLTHLGHLHGNIGVTQNTQMINSEIELRRYDVYLDIARQFERRFITQIY